jgi:glycosyltransferase involved in cell wall biosynthesis
MIGTVGIVLPVYNAQATLEETISSILSQTYRDFWLVIVNDGSTDNSGSIIDKLAKMDSRICLLEHDNQGPGYTRNRGIDLIAEKRLEYVAFVDADDVWLPKKLECQANIITKDPSVDIVVTDTIAYDHAQEFEPKETGRVPYIDVPDILQFLCLQNFPFQPATSLVRVNLFANIMKYSECVSDISGEDYLPFLYFAFFDARFVWIRLPLYGERQLSGSLQRSSRTRQRGSIARVRAIRRLFEEHSTSSRMTPRRLKLLEAAEDRYRTWVLEGIRRSNSYGEAIRESMVQFPNFHNKYFYFRELIKALLIRRRK